MSTVDMHPFTLPVDFHSWRRAFNQALADAGVNAQTAMTLAGHSSMAAHQVYLANAAKVVAMPESALPKLPVPEQNSTNQSGTKGKK
jgi:integrase